MKLPMLSCMACCVLTRLVFAEAFHDHLAPSLSDGAPVWGQGPRVLWQDWFTEEEFAVALFHEPDAEEADRALALELFKGYALESKQAFEVAAGALRQLSDEKRGEASEDPRWAAAVVAYQQTQKALDESVIEDLAVLLPGGEEAGRRVARLLDRLRQLRRSQMAAGKHAHPLVAWTRAFRERDLPAEVRDVLDAYEGNVARRLEARAVLYETPASAEGLAVARHIERIRRIDLDIALLSDQYAAHIASHLSAGDGRRYLQQYYDLRWPALYRTEFDARLEAAEAGQLDPVAREGVEHVRLTYWDRLRAINSDVERAEMEFAQAGVDVVLRKVGHTDLNDARRALREATEVRRQRLAALLRELDDVLRSVEENGR